jgi:hypothetical protein
MLVSRNSVFGTKEVRDAVISVLADSLAQDQNASLGVAKTLRFLSRAIGARAEWQELAILSRSELHEVVEYEATKF